MMEKEIDGMDMILMNIKLLLMNGQNKMIMQRSKRLNNCKKSLNKKSFYSKLKEQKIM